MRETQVLFKEGIKRLTRVNWWRRGNVKVIKTTAEDVLKSRGFEVLDIQEFLRPPKPKEKIEVVGLYDRDIPKDENHPDYKMEPCFIYKNNDVLIEGLEQAKVLTNTVEICKGLPESVIESENKLSLPDETHAETQKKIKLCCMFDAMQEKLPKRKDPLRPAWNFPRDFGITTERKNKLLCKNLFMVCEQFAENANDKSAILNAFFSTPFNAHKKKIQFELTNELVVTTQKKLKVLAEPSSTHGIDLPALGPMDCTAGLIPYHFYEMQDTYFPGSNSKWPHVQTVFIHFSTTQVKNITEEEVTEAQIHGRSLVSGFCVAAAAARSLFGHDIEKLPEPVVVPVVQAEGRMFHFAIFQLNTLDLHKDSTVKNIFWNSERIPLYSECEFKEGRPTFTGYNPDVIRRLINFYNIQ